MGIAGDFPGLLHLIGLVSYKAVGTRIDIFDLLEDLLALVIVLQGKALQRRPLGVVMDGRHLFLPSFLIVLEVNPVQLKVNVASTQFKVLLEVSDLVQCCLCEARFINHFFFDHVGAPSSLLVH